MITSVAAQHMITFALLETWTLVGCWKNDRKFIKLLFMFPALQT
jgi:hypothetical protein